MTLSTAEEMAAKKKQSGTVWTEEDYREKGYGTVKLRLEAANLKKLARLAKGWGVSRQQAVDKLIDRAKESRATPPKDG
jgi:hypothetical protein